MSKIATKILIILFIIANYINLNKSIAGTPIHRKNNVFLKKGKYIFFDNNKKRRP